MTSIDPRVRAPLLMVLAWASIFQSFASGAESTDPVVLPPFIVEITKNGPAWRYAEIPGFELLARCSDSKARALGHAYYRAHRLHSVLLPERFQMRHDVPTKLIFYEEDLWPVAMQEAASIMIRSLPLASSRRPPVNDRSHLDRLMDADRLFRSTIHELPGGYTEPISRPAPVFFKDMRLADDDAVVIFTLAPADASNFFRAFLKPAYLAHLLGNRTPSLPTWFVSGFLGIYHQLEVGDDMLKLPPIEWLSTEPTTAAKQRPAVITDAFLPLLAVISDDRAVNDAQTLQEQLIARSQRELFIRWALDPSNDGLDGAFWKLIERCCTEPVSEKLFQECFGMSSVDAAAALAKYVPEALRDSVTWNVQPSKEPTLRFTNATHGQIARIRGEWERLQISYVRSVLPEVEPRYLEKARATFMKAYDSGDRDPRLMAQIGLCEFDAGMQDDARRYLKAAVNKGVVRPRAYAVLARLLLAEIRNRFGKGEKIPFEQVAVVIDLLKTASGQAPQLPAIYQIAAEVWEQCDRAPTSEELRFLFDGASLYPRSAELAYRIAMIHIGTGSTEAAAVITRRAVQLGASDAYVQRLHELDERLGSSIGSRSP